MAKKRRISTHQPDETEPCEECRAEIALLRRERELEAMWRRRAKKR